MEIHIYASLSRHFVQPVLEGKHDVAAHGVGTGFTQVVQLTDSLHILVLIEKVKARQGQDAPVVGQEGIADFRAKQGDSEGFISPQIRIIVTSAVTSKCHFSPGVYRRSANQLRSK